jgi:hypothetical protein
MIIQRRIMPARWSISLDDHDTQPREALLTENGQDLYRRKPELDFSEDSNAEEVDADDRHPARVSATAQRATTRLGGHMAAVVVDVARPGLGLLTRTLQ